MQKKKNKMATTLRSYRTLLEGNKYDDRSNTGVTDITDVAKVHPFAGGLDGACGANVTTTDNVLVAKLLADASNVSPHALRLRVESIHCAQLCASFQS